MGFSATIRDQWPAVLLLSILCGGLVVGFFGIFHADKKRVIDFEAERIAANNRDISLAYAKRVFGPLQHAGWGGPLAGLVRGVAVPAEWDLSAELDLWVKEGILVKGVLHFPRLVPADPVSVRSAYVYRLRYTESGPARCPVGSFPDSIPWRYPFSVRGWSTLRFYGDRLVVGGVELLREPFRRAAGSDSPYRATLQRAFWSAKGKRYLRGSPLCYPTSGLRALEAALEWTAFLLDEGVIHNIELSDGRLAFLARSGVDG